MESADGRARRGQGVREGSVGLLAEAMGCEQWSWLGGTYFGRFRCKFEDFTSTERRFSAHEMAWMVPRLVVAVVLVQG